jgi:sensor histidine kinase YesM
LEAGLKNIALYWKCQLVGWALYAGIYTFIDVFKRNLSDKYILTYILTGVLIFMLGLFLSHLMKGIIKCWGLLKLKIKKQVIFLFVLTVFFTILFWLFFNIIFYSINGAAGMLMPLLARVATFQSQAFGGFLGQCLTFSVPFLVWNLFYGVIHYIGKFKVAEFEKLNKEKQLLELEAKALRAQMNPHFIFNCLNSIKSLIQEQQTEKGVTYLTTFSKLIRTLFNNADKKEITLYDEIATCRLYLQLEAMRFDTKFSYQVNIDENMDLKSVQVPALIIQPFIENAIWHGIVPKGTGGSIALTVAEKNGDIEIAIEDNGIGRGASQQNKSINQTHQSKGVNLTQARLELDNLLQQRQAQLRTIDKKDENGIATGTKVIITIKEEV